MSHVLVARLDNDGDVLLAGPAVRAIADGAERVTLLCGRRGRTAAALLPGVDAIEEFTAPWIDPHPAPVSPPALAALIERVAALRPDEAVIFTSFHQTPLPLALCLRLAGVPRIAAISDDYPGSLLDVRHRVSPDLHEVERGLSLAAAAGYALPAGDDRRLRVRRPGLEPVEPPYLVVHPGASVPARTWLPRRFAELVARLRRLGHRVVVTGSPAERELTARVAGAPSDDVLDLGGATDLEALADVLAGASTVVVGNTGPAHLAAAVGTPVVSLFPPTVPSRCWAPWGVERELLELSVPCAGCRATTCPHAVQECMHAITVDHVVDALERLTARCAATGASA